MYSKSHVQIVISDRQHDPMISIFLTDFHVNDTPSISLIVRARFLLYLIVHIFQPILVVSLQMHSPSLIPFRLPIIRHLNMVTFLIHSPFFHPLAISAKSAAILLQSPRRSCFALPGLSPFRDTDNIAVIRVAILRGPKHLGPVH